MRKLLFPALALALAAMPVLPAYAGKTPPPARPSLAIEGGGTDGASTVEVAPELKRATGPVEVVVRLTQPSIAEAAGKDIKWRGAKITGAEQQSYKASLDAQQQTLASQLVALGGVETARLTRALNAVVIKIDAAQIPAVSRLPGVLSVRPVGTYQLADSDVVQYIEANLVQWDGFDGTGIRVAVLDSGIDYTHKNLGGAGTDAAYTAAYGTDPSDLRNTTRDSLFPTAKVVEGFDFVGEQWPNGPRTEDADPIDYEGHGTHVGDIIAGELGVAPGASLYAVKVCSAVASSCNGVALLKAVDYALDPNGDGDISDQVDVINLSLGSDYGQEEDDLSYALGVASQLGVIVVASAGNAANRPYIVGSPSTQPEVVSVAQTQLPSAVSYPLVTTIDGIQRIISNTATVDWAPVGDGFAGSAAFVGRGCPADPAAGSPDDPYQADPAGKVAIIDRGFCAVSLKVDRAAKAGAIGVLIVNSAAGDPPSFGFGGGDTFVPTLVLTQGDGNALKAALAAGKSVTATVSDAVSVSLKGSMAGTSSRGPSISYQSIKPDIGAPGASMSAVAGSGTGEEAFGGTSGAAPVVAGVAALLRQQYPSRLPAEIKALMVNSAERNIYVNPANKPGYLAPIARIGGGEVRAKAASAGSVSVYDNDSEMPNLSFGYHSPAQVITLTKTVRIQNYLNERRIFNIEPNFRYADDEASGAVKINAPLSVWVRPNGAKTFKVQLVIDPSKLPDWPFLYVGGSQGGNGALLDGPEYDGFLRVYDVKSDIAMPWHVLPHKSAAYTASTKKFSLASASSFSITNSGVAGGNVDVFALLGKSAKVPDADLPLPGGNFAYVDMRYVGARAYAVPSATGPVNYMEFGINTWRPHSHPAYPAGFEVDIDSDNNGTVDYFVFHQENVGFGLSGQTLVYVQKVGSPTATAVTFLDSDLNSGNTIMAVPFASIGITNSRTISFSVLAYDNYFSGFITDAIENMRFNPYLPKYDADDLFPVIAPGGSSTVNVQAVSGGRAASPSQAGFLLLYRDAKVGREAEAINVTP